MDIPVSYHYAWYYLPVHRFALMVGLCKPMARKVTFTEQRSRFIPLDPTIALRAEGNSAQDIVHIEDAPYSLHDTRYKNSFRKRRQN